MDLNANANTSEIAFNAFEFDPMSGAYTDAQICTCQYTPL